MTDKNKDNQKLDESHFKDNPSEEPSVEENSITIKEGEYKKLISDLEEYKDRNVRLFAEFDVPKSIPIHFPISKSSSNIAFSSSKLKAHFIFSSLLSP